MKALTLTAALLVAAACGGSGSAQPQKPRGDTMDAAGERPAGDAPTEGSADADPALGSPLAKLSPEEIARGGKVYEDECAFCHGEKAEGQGKSPALRGDGALSRFATSKELFDYTKAEMPKNDKGSLSDADTAAVLAWLTRGK